jgi:hypothetical protein
MEKKPPHNIADLRRQRERIRRITIGTLLIAVLTVLGSCDGLVRRDGGAQSPSAATPTAPELRRLVLRVAGQQSDRPRQPSTLNSPHGLQRPCRAGHAGTAGMTNHPCKP